MGDTSSATKKNKIVPRKNKFCLIKLLVKKVEGPEHKIIETKAVYKVTEYNISNPHPENKKRINWQIKNENKIIAEFKKHGDTLEYIIPESLSGKSIIVMAFIIAPSVKVSVTTKIISYSKEILLVVGTEQHSETKGNKLMFPAQAIREVRELYKSVEYLTLLIFKDGYTGKELDVIKNALLTLNKKATFLSLDSRDELIRYINTRTKQKNGKNRDNVDDGKKIVLIEIIKIFSHGLPSRITFDLEGWTSDLNLELNVSHVSQLSPEAFAPNAKFYSYACRTGNAGPLSQEQLSANQDWKAFVKPEQSLAQKLADHLDITVYAYIRRSNYLNTWNDKGDKDYQKHYIDIKDKSVDITIWNLKTWDDYDEALWNTQGAYGNVIVGDEPDFVPRKMFVFEKGKESKEL